MANFQKNGRNVHGEVIAVAAGQPFEIGLWGPLDTRSTPPVALDVLVTPPNAAVRIENKGMLAGQNVMRFLISGLPVGATLLQAKDRGNLVWSQVTLEAKAGTPAGAGTVVTKEQLKDKAGVVQARYPASPAIVSLVKVLTRGTGGGLKAGIASLESAGRSGNLYEHTAGLALDIYRNSGVAAQQAQAHNLIRVFIANRREMGWRNMFYEQRGFTASGVTSGSVNHHDHIHIDWMDFSLLKFEGTNKFDRSQWTEITWPTQAQDGSRIDTPAIEAAIRNAWETTSAALLTDAEIATLYA